jgi:hypothetical protein
MKQINLFGIEESEQEKSYSSKINAPIYEPKNKKPNILELVDSSKFSRLRNELQNANIPEDEKKFLMMAATRHLVFNYELIADYYSHSNKEIQNFMERSALVIIDFEKAIQLGYVRLSEDIKKQYLQEYGE